MVSSHAITHNHSQPNKLKRTLSLFEVTVAGIGIILGAGIYVLVGKAAGIAGDSVWMSFVLAALIAATTGLSYAELSSLFPRAGAEYTYAEHAFNKKIAFAVGWLIILTGIFSGAAVSLGFAGYFSALFGTPIVLTALALVLLLSFILYVGIKISVWLAIIFTIIEATGLLIIIGIGLPKLATTHIDFMSMQYGISGVVAAAALIFFAFIGFESIVRLSEETKNPTKTIPKALVLSIVITTVIYILVALASISALGYEALAASSAPLADVAATLFGPTAFTLLSVIALFATANTVLLILLGTTRIVYGMAEEKSLPKLFEYVSSKTKTPVTAIILTMLATLAFIFVKDISFAAKLTDYMVFATFFVINAAVIALRYSAPKSARKFKIPWNLGKFPIIPAAGMLLIVWLSVGLGADILVWGTAILVFGILLSFMYKRK